MTAPRETAPRPAQGGMLNSYLSTLYRGRPFTKTIPFAVTITDNLAHALWVPNNAYFDFIRMYIRSNIAGIDVTICDTNKDQVIGFVVPEVATYTPVNLDPAGYRSINLASNFLGIVDPLASGATFKGWIMGWEVTREGTYR